MARLILVCGAAGVGKTTLARALAAPLHALHLSTDLIAEDLYPGDRSSDAYLAARDPIYRATFRIAAANLTLGNDTIIDAPFGAQLSNEVWCQYIEQVAAHALASIAVIRCTCDAVTQHQRVASRAEPRDAHKLADWSSYLASLPRETPIPFAHIEINTGDSLAANVAAALAFLGSTPSSIQSNVTPS